WRLVPTRSHERSISHQASESWSTTWDGTSVMASGAIDAAVGCALVTPDTSPREAGEGLVEAVSARLRMPLCWRGACTSGLAMRLTHLVMSPLLTLTLAACSGSGTESSAATESTLSGPIDLRVTEADDRE